MGSHAGHVCRSKAGRKQTSQEYKPELLHAYDMESDRMGMTDLGKIFGMPDMYRDDANPMDTYGVEKRFSKLESEAALVFKSLDDAEKRGRSSVELTRSQLNTMRQFLFLVSYRNVRHARQFIKGVFDTDTAGMVEEYRVKHGLADTRAVWLYNLSLLLDDEHWEAPVDERLLWMTRVDYKWEAWDMQLGLYRASLTPSSS